MIHIHIFSNNPLYIYYWYNFLSSNYNLLIKQFRQSDFKYFYYTFY